MANDVPVCLLLDLPWEIRTLILRYALWIHRSTLPEHYSLSKEFIANRVPVVNYFDETRPKVTNIYVERFKRCNYRDGSGILGTNRQLREEMLAVIKTDGYVPNPRAPPFVLDLMVVRDIGVFPTWLTPPAEQTSGLEQDYQLKVILRVVKPNDNIPSSWRTAGQHTPTPDDKECGHRTRWSLVVALCFYAAGRLLLSPDWSPANDADNQTKTLCNISQYRAHRRPRILYKIESLLLDFRACERDGAGERIPLAEAEREIMNSTAPVPERASTVPFGQSILRSSRTLTGELSEPPSDPRRMAGYLLGSDILEVVRHMKLYSYLLKNTFSNNLLGFDEIHHALYPGHLPVRGEVWSRNWCERAWAPKTWQKPAGPSWRARLAYDDY
ncbi:hypothetical protein PWT90_08040 [Aphanocladium album]|nr:hypothetical protein PWT90_08040 [Aphanocladium album]